MHDNAVKAFGRHGISKASKFVEALTFCSRTLNVEDLFRDSSSTYQLKYISGAAGGQHSVLLRNDGKVST